MNDSIFTQGWRHPRYTLLAHRINEQCVDALFDRATSAARDVMPAMVLHNRDLWCRMDAVARKRIAALPFVIADMHFKDAVRWERYKAQPAVADNTDTSTMLPMEVCQDLALEIFHAARPMIGEDISSAKVIFGMTEAVAACVGSLTMQQLRLIAANQWRQLTLRWDEKPEFWRDLLIAALTADEAALATLQHQAKRWFMGEFISTRPEPRITESKDGV